MEQAVINGIWCWGTNLDMPNWHLVEVLRGCCPADLKREMRLRLPAGSSVGYERCLKNLDDIYRFIDLFERCKKFIEAKYQTAKLTGSAVKVDAGEMLKEAREMTVELLRKGEKLC